VSRFVDIPAARPRVGSVVTWAGTLGIAQAGLLCAVANASVSTFAVLAIVLSIVACVVVATAWFVRFAVPVAPRALRLLVPILFYGATVIAAPQARALLAMTLLAPAIAWAAWLPRVSILGVAFGVGLPRGATPARCRSPETPASAAPSPSAPRCVPRC